MINIGIQFRAFYHEEIHRLPLFIALTIYFCHVPMNGLHVIPFINDVPFWLGKLTMQFISTLVLFEFATLGIKHTIHCIEDREKTNLKRKKGFFNKSGK